MDMFNEADSEKGYKLARPERVQYVMVRSAGGCVASASSDAVDSGVGDGAEGGAPLQELRIRLLRSRIRYIKFITPDLCMLTSKITP
jgi:hypothetical protein